MKRRRRRSEKTGERRKERHEIASATLISLPSHFYISPLISVD
jgi:hypothetical protein